MEKRDAKEEFLTAFWKLYEKKDLEKISIRELCQAAGYNRTTFYAHYENIYALLETAIGRIVLPIREAVAKEIDFRCTLEPSVFIEIFLTALQKENSHIELIFRRNHYFLLGERVKREWMSIVQERYGDMNPNVSMLEYVMEYQLSAVLGVVRFWIQTEKHLPQDEFVKRIYRITERGVLTVVREELGGRGDV